MRIVELVQRFAHACGVHISRRPPYLRRRVRYRVPARALRQFAEVDRQDVTLVAPDESALPSAGFLYDLWRTVPGGHKWHHYFAIYEQIIRSFENRPIRMLEIGVYHGGSVRMWLKALPPGSVIVGIDIDPECKRYEDVGNKLYIRIGDQSDRSFLQKIVEEFGPFDFILDDGSHMCSHMIASFVNLFIRGLAKEGVYLVEDTCTNFWPDYRDQPYSFVAFAKELVDVMHWHYFRHTSELRFRAGHPARVQKTDVPRIAGQIKGVTFLDSVVVIHKRGTLVLPVSEHL